MLGNIHFYAGIGIVIIFLLTGQYMDHRYDHLQDMELMNRALFRAGHLYILLFGLIHVALGINSPTSSKPLFSYVHLFASIITFLATFLVIYGFFTELPTETIERPLTRMSLYLVLFGVSVKGIVHLFEKRKK